MKTLTDFRKTVETGVDPRLNLTNTSLRSTKSFFSEVTKKWMEMKQFRISV